VDAEGARSAQSGGLWRPALSMQFQHTIPAEIHSRMGLFDAKCDLAPSRKVRGGQREHRENRKGLSDQCERKNERTHTRTKIISEDI